MNGGSEIPDPHQHQQQLDTAAPSDSGTDVKKENHHDTTKDANKDQKHYLNHDKNNNNTNININNNTSNANTQNFPAHSPHYLDASWASNLLMDPGNDLLYNMDFSTTNVANSNPSSSIAHNIQYQNDIHSAINLNEAMLHSNNSRELDVKLDSNSNSIHINQPTQDYSNINSQVLYPYTNQSIKKASDKLQPNTKTPTNEPKTKQRRPCDHCRRKKTKCVIIPGTNNCAQCETKSLTCTYIGQAAKRKPVDIPGDPSESIKRSKKDGSIDTNANLALLQNEIVPPDVPIRDVQPIQDYSVMNNSLLKKTLSLQFPRSSFYIGPTSYLYDINLLNLVISSQNSSTSTPTASGKTERSSGKIEQVNLSNTISLRKVSDNAQFVLKDDQSPQSYQTMSNDVDTIEKFIAPHGQILIDLYFRIVHPSYPILHKKVFLEKYSRTHREFSAPLLAAVYVLAIQWWDYDPQLNRFPRPNVELVLKIGLTNYLLEILKRPKLSAVQAGLLLLQCKHIIRVNRNANNNQKTASEAANHNINNLNIPNKGTTSSFTDSDYSDWVLCSQVIALSEELGLGLNCNNWKLPKWERGLRKRLAWAVYMEDKWLSLKNSRPSHINDINWVVVNLLEEDFPEKHGDGDLKEGSSDIDNGKKNFMNLINLSTILSDILTQLYSMRAMNDITDINQVLKLAKPLQLRLRNWYHSLPIELQMTSVQPRKLCSNGYLQLAYFATELTLHRKIITIIYQQLQDGETPPAQLVEVCRTAAKTRLLASIEFVRDLKPEHIHSFWHSSSSANFTLIGTFAAILFMSSTSKEESSFYKDQIYNYRWILKISSKGFDQVGDALSKLDLVLNHIPGLLNDGTDLPLVVPKNSTIDHQKLQKQQNQSAFSPPVQSPYVNSSGRPSPVSYQNTKYGSNQNTSNTNTPNLNNNGIHSNNNNSNNDINNNGNNGSVYTNNNKSRHYRVNSQQSANSPYTSPQSFNTPPVTSQSQTLVSRGGQFVNSPQSSQGLSPKEIIKQQKTVIAQGVPTPHRNSNGPEDNEQTARRELDSKTTSPNLTRSPVKFNTVPSNQQINHSPNQSDQLSNENDNTTATGNNNET